MDKGVLIPRMTSEEMKGIENPKNGLLVYNTSENAFFFYKENTWENLQSNMTNAMSCLTPEDFGAVADDGLDDTAAFQSMFTAAGDNVNLCIRDNGAYHINEELDLTAKHNLNLDFSNATIFFSGDSTLLNIEKATGKISVTNLTISFKDLPDDNTTAIGIRFKEIITQPNVNSVNIQDYTNPEQIGIYGEDIGNIHDSSGGFNENVGIFYIELFFLQSRSSK